MAGLCVGAVVRGDDEGRRLCGAALCNSSAAGRAPTGPKRLGATQMARDGDRLLVMLGESPFRIAVADGWCHEHHHLPVCSILPEIAREVDPRAAPAWLELGRRDEACALRERSACETLCAASRACWAHETYYCTKTMDDGSAITVAYVHNGFGVAPNGPFFHHGSDPRSSVARVTKALLADDSRRSRHCADWLPQPADASASMAPDDWAALAHRELVGDFVAAIPRALGFKQVDALVLGVGYWDLARMRSVEHNVQALDDPQYMSWWLSRWSHNASCLLGTLRGTPTVSRLLYMTAALSPAQEPQKSSGGGNLFGIATGRRGRRAAPDDFFFGERIARINAAGRAVAKQLGVELIDWESAPLIAGAAGGTPWSTQLQDFIHPTTEAAVIMVEYTLRRIGWVDSAVPLPFHRPRAAAEQTAAPPQTVLLWLGSVCGGVYLLSLCYGNRGHSNHPTSEGGTRERLRKTAASNRSVTQFDIRAALQSARRQRLDRAALAHTSLAAPSVCD